MSFTIPNEADAGFADQAEVDKVDIEILTAGLSGDAVRSGCAVTAQGTPDMTVAVAAGEALIGRKYVVVAAGNVTITAADGANPRFDLIVVNDAGTKSAVAGTAASNPVFPSIPANSIVLATVYVPAADTDIDANQITDKRIFAASSAQFGNDTLPTSGWHLVGIWDESDLSESPDRVVALQAILYANPSADYAGLVFGLDGTVAIQTGNAQNFTGTLAGIVGGAVHDGLGTLDDMLGVTTDLWVGSSATVTRLIHYNITGDADIIGTVPDQYGFFIPTLDAATNNYGIYIENATTFAIWVDAGNVRFDGRLGVYGDALSDFALLTIGKEAVYDGAFTFAIGAQIDFTVSQEATDNVIGSLVTLRTAAVANTHDLVADYYATVPGPGAGATITNAYGLFVQDMTHAQITNGYGVYVTGAKTYAIWADAGLNRFDGDGTHVFELPQDDIDPTGAGMNAATGRIPVKIAGATRYIPYYT